MDATIRRARLEDLEGLAELWMAFLNEQTSLDERVRVSDDAMVRWRNDYPSWIDRERRYIVVAESDGKVQGFAAAVRSAPAPIFEYVPEMYVEELYVAPEARRKGVGRALFDSLRTWGESWGARRARLSVLAGNDVARTFWNRLGLTDMSVSMAVALDGQEEEPVRARSRIGFGV